MKNFLKWLESTGTSQFQRQKDIVFRKTDHEEWQTIQSGMYSGIYWSSNPNEYVDHNKRILLIAKRDGFITLNGSQIKGRNQEEQKKAFESGEIDYYNLERKELSDIIAAYEFKNWQYIQIYSNKYIKKE